jgi:hypothetical protein
LLKALEDENKTLKQEVTYLSSDLKKFISMVEILLEENKYIREHINQKNRDIAKILETIGLNGILFEEKKNYFFNKNNKMLKKSMILSTKFTS